MDIQHYLIVDLEKQDTKQMFITERVESINRGPRGMWAVKFVGSSRIFNYNPSRLLCLTNPSSIDTDEKGIYINNRHINNVKEILCFSDAKHSFYHVTYAKGYYENFEGKYVYITRTRIDKNGGSTWNYLQKLAAETGLTTEENVSILSKQYELVDVNRDNVPLAQFLGDQTKLKKYCQPAQVYYPFGCNASQKLAVERALTNQVSIIQGPPGTGKTQTILNIIANLLMKNKTVLVVSNNNSAVENVAEKMDSVGLGFIVAQLGSVLHKEAFIANQPEYPSMDDWQLQELDLVKQRETDALNVVSQGFEAQIRQAQLKVAYDELLKETKYHDMLETEVSGSEWLHKKESAALLNFLNLYQRIIENDRKPNLLFRLKWAFKFGFKAFSFLKESPTRVIAQLEAAYYVAHRTKLEAELEEVESTLERIDMKQRVEDLRSSSLQVLKHKLAKRYRKNRGVTNEVNHRVNNKANDGVNQGTYEGQKDEVNYGECNRKFFTIKDLKSKAEEFLQEYPVVLSTTYSAKSCISKDMVFDYVIMDEASQVDIKTGALALSCAMNAVIVGDDKQLPNVISREEELAVPQRERSPTGS